MAWTVSPVRLVVAAAREVGLREHADHLVAVDHREAADLVLGHRAHRLLDGVVRADGDDLARPRSPTVVEAGSLPAASTFTTMSRSVIMPVRRSPSQTGSAP